jgi:hypothetical protein
MRSSSKRGSQKRDTAKAHNATLYAKRTFKGRFREMDEKGRALSSDRRRRAKTKTRSGYGDRGSGGVVQAGLPTPAHGMECRRGRPRRPRSRGWPRA